MRMSDKIDGGDALQKALGNASFFEHYKGDWIPDIHVDWPDWALEEWAEQNEDVRYFWMNRYLGEMLRGDGLTWLEYKERPPLEIPLQSSAELLMWCRKRRSQLKSRMEDKWLQLTSADPYAHEMSVLLYYHATDLCPPDIRQSIVPPSFSYPGSSFGVTLINFDRVIEWCGQNSDPQSPHKSEPKQTKPIVGKKEAEQLKNREHDTPNSPVEYSDLHDVKLKPHTSTHQWIIDTIHAKGSRMQRGEIKQAWDGSHEADNYLAKTTLNSYLGHLKANGLLVSQRSKPNDEKGLGYGLPEWNN